MVGSDAAAQSDIYAAAMLAGVIGSDCIVLAGPRDQAMPAEQQARLQAADAGGFVVGGVTAVPAAKIEGRSMTRLFGPDRWATARRVGQHAAGSTPDASATPDVPPKIDGVAVPPQSQGSCAGQVPIVVGSDAAAQSDIYAAAMLAGVIGSDCIVLAGRRGVSMSVGQRARLQAADSGGFVVGGVTAVPAAKIAGRTMTRLSGADRWATARLVGRRAAGDATAGTPTTGSTQTWEQVASSVVLVQCLDSSGRPTSFGSGFAVGDGRLVVTNHHVVFDGRGRPCSGIRALVRGTFEQAPVQSVTMTVKRAVETRDLALLSLDPSEDSLPPVAIATSPLQAGERITALGYPGIGGETMTLTTGRYSGITTRDGVRWIKTDTQIAPGNSGGPAFNEQRQLVGVATALVLAQAGGGTGVIGSLGLLAPAADVAALLAGDMLDDSADDEQQEAIAALFAQAAAQRAEIVSDLTEKINAGTYGINRRNVLRGPGGFRIDLSHCPDGWSDTTGITDSQVRIGHTTAQSGNLAAYGNIAYGWENYFNWINENDPIMVGGSARDLTLIIKDDAYVAAQTIGFVDVLIEAENVFSILTLGSPNTLAVYDKINEECIPHPFVMTGHPAWGDPVVHPWTSIMQMSYSTEAILWGAWIEQNLTSELPARVAAVVMDNDFGLAYETAFAAWADAHPEAVSSFTAVRHHPDAPSLAREMRDVANADPDVFISMTAGNPCLLAIRAAGQSGLIDDIRAKGGALFTPSVCKGIQAYMKPAGDFANDWWIVGGGIKDSTDPTYTDEPFIAFINDNLEAGGLDPEVSLYATGYTYGYPYGEALRIAADLPGGLTRTNLILAVRSIDIYHPMILDGINTQLNGNADAYFVEGSDFSQFDAAERTWNQVGDAVDVNGQTPNCVWISSSLQGIDSRCGTPTRERLRTIAVRGPADVEDTFSAWANAHRADRDGPQYRLKPGYWRITADSLCIDWDDAAEVWRQGSRLGEGWIDVSGASVQVSQSTAVRVEHGDWVEVTTWSGGNRGATKCQLDWVTDLD
ncbi:trypsin-like peptidase domain-containing protein [Candidatus Poriferisodalis sp.]|uniref:trypsin-like peptidase domain-containing protein n=1 Tax=Candidatus Poriferisodalis sp. TaxID=3101277 RepID=UPI003B5B8C69